MITLFRALGIKSIIRKSAECTCQQGMYNFKNRFLKYSQCRRQTLENRATNLIEGRQVGTFFSCFMTSSFLGFYLIRLRGLVDKVLDSVSPSRVPGNYCNTSRHALNIASPPGNYCNTSRHATNIHRLHRAS